MALSDAFHYLGVATSCYLLAQITQHLYCYLRPSSLQRYRAPGKESWALVTGASDGIGLGFAQELCKRGFNVFLHGRSREKLLRVQEQLRAEYPSAKTKIIVFDAAGPTDHIVEIAHDVGDAHLTVLINNVGGGDMVSPAFKRLEDMTQAEVQGVISLNAIFMTELTRVLLPILEKNEPSLIINISSASSTGLPWLSVYGSAKGYVDSFSNALNAEMRAEGRKVEVLGIRVGSTSTPKYPVATGLFTPTSRTMASAALDRVGCGRSLVWGYWGHAIQRTCFDWLPEKIVQAIITKYMKDLKNIDEKKKQE